MTRQSLNRWQHALLSLGILFLFLALLFFALVMPAMTGRHAANERIADLQLQRARYKSAEKELMQVQNQLEQLSHQHLYYQEDFLEEKQQTLAAADLQQYIKKVIEAHEGNLVSIQPINEPADQPFPKVTIRIQMRGNTPVLQKTLYQIESSRPRLFIENINVQRQYPAEHDDQAQAGQLDIRFDVSGYIYVSDT